MPKKKSYILQAPKIDPKAIFNLSILTMVLIALYFLLVGPQSFFPYTLKAEKRKGESTIKVSETIFALDAQNKSGETGLATFSTNGNFQVYLEMKGAPSASQPAHIHKGACEKLGDIVYPLTSVVNGTSTTELQTTTAMLKSKLPLALNVHASEKNLAKSVACVDLSF